jgi:lipoate-protein ligase A
MAVDEMLFTATSLDCPTLRFYTWSEPTLSLGYFQSHEDRATHAASQSCAWVRRSTGGGAILHDQELTYSIVLPLGERWSKGAADVYDWFHDALCDCLALCGAHATRCPATLHTLAPEPFLCFQRRAQGEVLLGEHKIGGSAQRRRQGALLQHGSILWSRSAFAPELLGIRELHSLTLELSDFSKLFLESILHKKGLKTPINNSQWSVNELKQAEEIEKRQYSAISWNCRR